MIIWKQLAAAVSAALIVSTSWGSNTLTIGRVYDIAEPDALEEIQARAEQIDWQQAMSTPRDTWSAYRHAPVGVAQVSRTREHPPYHTVEQAVYAATGELLYPVGYQFNPLDYLTLPRRVVVIRPEHGKWAAENILSTDLVLLAGADMKLISDKLERPVFLLDQRTQERLDVQVAPSIIEQRGSVLVITEYALEEGTDASD